MQGREKLQGGETFSDSYVDIRLRQQQQRTQTIKKNLNPEWNEEFRFEVVDDSFLQNTPIEFKVTNKLNITSIIETKFRLWNKTYILLKLLELYMLI